MTTATNKYNRLSPQWVDGEKKPVGHNDITLIMSRHKNNASRRQESFLKILIIVLLLIGLLGLTATRILLRRTQLSSYNHQQFFHFLTTRKSANIYLWDVNEGNSSLVMKNSILFSEEVGNPETCNDTISDICLSWAKDPKTAPNAKLTIKKSSIAAAANCYKFNVSAPVGVEISACIPLSGERLYGGPVNSDALWPSDLNKRINSALATGQGGNEGIVEPYWITSGGRVVYVPRDIPLFISQNTSHLCLHSKIAAPYRWENLTSSNLKFYYCKGEDVKQTHLVATRAFFGLPTGPPDARMVQYPIWSTWKRFGRGVNESLVYELSMDIAHYEFNHSHIEIDDAWETCYGEFKFGYKFPTIEKLMADLRVFGFRFTLWTHPFVGSLCPSFIEARDRGFLVSSADKKVNSTVWWDGIAGLIDFTNPDAVSWWRQRLASIRDRYNIDAFKFDAGETQYMPGSPEVALLNVPMKLQPNVFTTQYVENAATVGSEFGMTEVRVVYRNQQLPIFVRMSDRLSEWGNEGGLKSLVPSLLGMNMVGYSYILPDMIGGNGPNKPSKELFIRWIQATTFMPTMQFSFVPWDYDAETIEIAKKFTRLHFKYSDRILDLAAKKMKDGTPINLPIWWLDPKDKVAQEIDSEFLLGEDLLVAPVLEPNVTYRDVYLPRGNWQVMTGDDKEGMIFRGPIWLIGYTVGLDELAYFQAIS